ncbi:MAG: hypothetical protein Q9182_004782 [Xanthomendoza sp. 2 TL-2023]
MSLPPISKSSSSNLNPSVYEAPPPSYSESVNISPTPNPTSARVSTLIDSYILPHLSEFSKTVIVLVPSNVATLFYAPKGPSTNVTPAFAFPGETFIGSLTGDDPTVIRLSGADNRLGAFQSPTLLRELGDQLRARLREEGHQMVLGLPQANARDTGLIAGSRNTDWRTVHQDALKAGEARVLVELTEVCLRTENEMGLYETRSGRSVVVRVEFGLDEEDDWLV